MTWTVDKAHSQVTFAVRHMMISTVRGQFGDFDATIELDEQHPERSTVTASINVASVATGQTDRDAHLRSADFFDAEHYPTMTFASKQIERKGDDEFVVRGDLTVKDVTKEVELRGEFRGPVPHWGGGSAVGFSLNGEIDREAFSLRWNQAMETGGVLVGKNVKIAIEAEVVGSAAAVTPEQSEAVNAA